MGEDLDEDDNNLGRLDKRQLLPKLLEDAGTVGALEHKAQEEFSQQLLPIGKIVGADDRK
eukprot:CAMPEP_0198115470 /NCGR_PEP_ID=MMETSP1442-20131203/6568_1 /TAXON_ID= /ORGANISM="Craspedostauros australis, Strain CCMP3328" /LENGTH=59 /DNA_ID=CAMNT_0043772985 /DNA_START=361 /DNA_END=540 /DNA_ORIENTATION=-